MPAIAEVARDIRYRKADISELLEGRIISNPSEASRILDPSERSMALLFLKDPKVVQVIHEPFSVLSINPEEIRIESALPDFLTLDASGKYRIWEISRLSAPEGEKHPNKKRQTRVLANRFNSIEVNFVYRADLYKLQEENPELDFFGLRREAA